MFRMWRGFRQRIYEAHQISCGVWAQGLLTAFRENCQQFNVLYKCVSLSLAPSVGCRGDDIRASRAQRIQKSLEGVHVLLSAATRVEIGCLEQILGVIV